MTTHPAIEKLARELSKDFKGRTTWDEFHPEVREFHRMRARAAYRHILSEPVGVDVLLGKGVDDDMDKLFGDRATYTLDKWYTAMNRARLRELGLEP